MGITIEARNYRGLRHVKWSPSGVCALVGANGSGKTTLLNLFEFLSVAFESGSEKAIEATGGASEFRNVDAEDSAITVALTVGELSWEMEWQGRNVSINPSNQCAKRGEQDILLKHSFVGTARHSKEPEISAWLGLRHMYEGAQKNEVAPLVSFLRSLRVYRHYNLATLRDSGSRHSDNSLLDPTGENAFDLLRKWRDQRELVPKYEFVVSVLVNAFPETFAHLDYESRKEAVSAKLFKPSSSTSLPSRVAPNGWFTALLHLCAVAGMPHGSLIAIDEFENTLHPYAIRVLIEAIRDCADEHDLTICLATHSPVVLDQFNEELSQVYVMEHGQETQPIRLTELHNPDWLGHFALGKLYAHGGFGAQHQESTTATAAP